MMQTWADYLDKLRRGAEATTFQQHEVIEVSPRLRLIPKTRFLTGWAWS